jgi:hypothetical protein
MERLEEAKQGTTGPAPRTWPESASRRVVWTLELANLELEDGQKLQIFGWLHVVIVTYVI